MMLRSLALACVVVLAGCQQRQAQSTAELSGFGFYAPFGVETSELALALPCEWQHGKAAPLEGHTYDFGCHGGRWGSVSLLVDAADHAPEYIERVRLIWRAWPNTDDPRINDVDVADQFVTEIAQRFVAPAMVPAVRAKFLSGETAAWQSPAADMVITQQHTARERIHRIEIRAKGGAAS